MGVVVDLDRVVSVSLEHREVGVLGMIEQIGGNGLGFGLVPNLRQGRAA